MAPKPAGKGEKSLHQNIGGFFRPVSADVHAVQAKTAALQHAERVAEQKRLGEEKTAQLMKSAQVIWGDKTGASGSNERREIRYPATRSKLVVQSDY